MSAPSAESPVFTAFCEPWVERAAAHWPTRWRRHEGLRRELTARLSAVAGRAIAAELQAWRAASLLEGATAEARWEDFERRVLPSDAVLRRLHEACPLLLPLLERVARDFSANVSEILSRWESRDRGEACDLRTGLSEPHAGGRTVAVVTGEDGVRWIYKPRSVRGEAWWADFVAWWNASGVPERLTLRAPAVEERDGHGWCEFVEERPVGAGEAAEAWSVRQGAHVAITWMFGLEDCHFANFVTAADQPVLVDAECLGAAFWRPEPPPLPQDLPWMFWPVWRTPLGGGMLPAWMVPKVPGQPMFVGPGLAPPTGRPMPVKRPRWRGVGTDELRLEMAGGLPFEQSQPVIACPRAVREGFSSALEHLLARRSEILTWTNTVRDPLSIGPRILLRNTAAYGQILEATTGPKFLASAEARAAAFRSIEGHPVIGGVAPEGLLAAETPFFESQTVPRFVLRPEGVCSETGGPPLLPADRKAALRQWNERWTGWTGEAASWQASLVEASLSQASELAPRFDAQTDCFLAAAKEIGEAFQRQAIQSAAGAAWLSLAAHPGGLASPAVPSGDFFSGSAGVAAFLWRLGAASGDAGFYELGSEAMRFADHWWSTAAGLGGPLPWSAFHGAGSVFTALASHPDWRSDGELVAVLDRWLRRAAAERGWLELPQDFVEGLPGFVVAVSAFVELPPARSILESAVPRLLALGPPEALPGQAHGRAGWIRAVLLAGQALQDEAVCARGRTAAAALPAAWADFERKPSVVQNPPAGWCNGAIGVGAALLPDAELHPLAAGFFARGEKFLGSGHGGHHVCCGESGRVLLLAEAARSFGDPEWSKQVRRGAEAILKSAREDGLLMHQGLPDRLTVPGWMDGMAGMGAALLAAHES